MAQTSDFETALALSRFGLGSGTDGVAALTGNVRDILKSEIAAGAPVPTDPGLQSTPDLLLATYQYQKDKQAERKEMRAATSPAMTNPQMGGQMSSPQMDGGQMNAMAPAKPMKPGADIPNPIRPAANIEIDCRFNGTMKTPAIGFNERMVMFWANHFCISTKKSQAVDMIAGAYEREAIRPYVFGRFADMLLAVETHPAMLLYLDNNQSIGPKSPANKTGNKGLNENLAREILELHTLGVGTGYSQADVTSFAKVITGWGINRLPRPGSPGGTFYFTDRQHEPGPQTILGKIYAQGGVDQGKAVLADLARHPATAKHIATKLARHFVSDTPPPALVARLSDAYLKSDGDLGEVSRTLIAAPEAWTPQLLKMRSPLEYVAAMLRATGATQSPQVIRNALNAMGQPWWQPAGPNGFPDTVSAWASPESLSTRMDYANGLAVSADHSIDPRQFAESRLGALLSDHTRDAIARAESQPQGLGLAFLSPEFMRR